VDAKSYPEVSVVGQRSEMRLRNILALISLLALGCAPAAQPQRTISYGDIDAELLDAASKGDTSMTKDLINKGANVNVKNRWDGTTALMTAARQGKIETVRILLEKGADVNAVDKDGYPVLIVAELMPFPPQFEIVKLLLKSGANVNAKADNGWTALMEAAKGHSYLRKVFIDKGHKDVATIPTEFARLLLERGAAVNAMDEAGRTALMIAAANGQTETVKLLIEAGADVNAKDHDGGTALIYLIEGYVSLMQRLPESDQVAVSTIPVEIASLLINAGADVNTKTKDGSTVLMGVSISGPADLARLLVERGANVNAKFPRNGMTVLMFAGDTGHTEIVELLIEKGADVNARDNHGVTALISAAAAGHSDVVRFLIEKGAGVNAKNNHGETALSRASKYNRTEIVELLRQAGAIE